VLGLTNIAEIPDARPIDAAVDAPEYAEGCSDRTREGFQDMAVYTDIAACDGAWSVPGLRGCGPACDHASGNDGALPLGEGCSAADVCAPGWRICGSGEEVFVALPAGGRTCDGLGAAPSTLYATGQSGGGANRCSDSGSNDFFGCGTYGPLPDSLCRPLDRVSDNMCFAIRLGDIWVCPDPEDEVDTVTKTDSRFGGGVLCCRNVGG